MSIILKGEISFDTVVPDDGVAHIEGCYRLNGREWQIFYFTHRFKGQWWSGAPEVTRNAVWQSGITGINVVYPKNKILNRNTVKMMLSEILSVAEWTEVRGPDSLNLK